jgi:dUTP pyrophosphatase
MFMKTKLQTPDCMPTRANPTDAGLDLRARSTCEMPLNIRVLLGTGVSVKIPQGYVGMLIPRSSLSKSGIVMTNSVGVIDSDYRGEIMASLMYTGGQNFNPVIYQGDRIVQLVIVPILLVKPDVDDWSDEEWNDTQRGTGGFGSTGKN